VLLIFEHPVVVVLLLLLLLLLLLFVEVAVAKSVVSDGAALVAGRDSEPTLEKERKGRKTTTERWQKRWQQQVEKMSVV
jgi:hypothetical protein